MYRLTRLVLKQEARYHLWLPSLPKASLNRCEVAFSIQLNLRLQIQSFVEMMELLFDTSLSSLSKFGIFHQLHGF